MDDIPNPPAWYAGRMYRDDADGRQCRWWEVRDEIAGESVAMMVDGEQTARLIAAAPDMLDLLERFRVDDLAFEIMQTEAGDCWTDHLIAVNRFLRREETTDG